MKAKVLLVFVIVAAAACAVLAQNSPVTEETLKSDFSNKWQEYLHSSKDKIENINTKSVLVGYNFVALYITRIDPRPCSAFRR